MRWFREHTGAALTIVSVALSTAVGIVSNILVDSWGWALLTALLVLVSCLALVEVIRHRATPPPPATAPAHAASGWPPPRGGIVVTGSSVRGNIAGGDIHQTKIGTGGLAAVVVAAAALGSGAIYLGRTDAAVPQRALDAAVADPAAGAYRESSLLLTATDVDPPGATGGTADISFSSKPGNAGGLALLNGAELAPIPNNGRPTAAVCRKAGGYTAALVRMPIEAGLSRCLRTSDGRYGTLSIASAETTALGGNAQVAWTVW
jgi:hypothetical protein